MARAVNYDEAVIAEFAGRLYQRAMSIIVWCTILGLLAGGVLASAATSSSPDDSKGIIIILFVVLGGLIGYAIGRERAFTLRLQAQVALCQVQIERNTRAAAATVVHSAAGPR